VKSKLVVVGALLVGLGATDVQADSVYIQYGTVQSSQTVQKDAKHAEGALAGGVLAAAMTGRRTRHRGLKIASSAAAGAAVQGAATSGTELAYNVALVDGGNVVVTTEQQDIREGDCVAVAQGKYANISRVGSYHCEGSSQDFSPPDHHNAGASACDAAKAELTAAETDDAVDLAVKKVRALCGH